MKRYPCRPRLCLIVLALLLLACGCTSDGDQGLLLRDDFDDPRSGWGADQREEFDRGYEEEEYFFELHEPNWFAWGNSGEDFDDVRVEVDAYLDSGSPDGHFGILCRYVDVDNFYYLAISADGYYAIFRREDDGDLDILTNGGGMAHSPAIRTGGQVNRIRAVCKEDKLSLYANGQMLDTVTDDALTQGDVGIGAGSGPAGNARVQFDDFVVVRP